MCKPANGKIVVPQFDGFMESRLRGFREASETKNRLKENIPVSRSLIRCS